ncbi:MAG: hypothetical protein JO040_07730 [Gemmatimonadetes bacterium]|nr:hypothetical protein [Gemmatimonadota bacterium]
MSPFVQARQLNPEAGSHPVSGDPREVRAALRADERSRREFPYYEARYGARGARFGASDGAWIATLAEHGQEGVDRQVLWLGEVLSCRGMPRWLLEHHLELLHDELVEALPERREGYAKLLGAAGLLRSQRHARLGEDDFLALARGFEDEVGPEWSRRLRGMGGILVAAVVDEKLGIDRAVPVLREWAADPSRFPPTWIAAVGRTLHAARARVGVTPPGEAGPTRPGFPR